MRREDVAADTRKLGSRSTQAGLVRVFNRCRTVGRDDARRLRARSAYTNPTEELVGRRWALVDPMAKQVAPSRSAGIASNGHGQPCRLGADSRHERISLAALSTASTAAGSILREFGSTSGSAGMARLVSMSTVVLATAVRQRHTALGRRPLQQRRSLRRRPNPDGWRAIAGSRQECRARRAGQR